MSPESDLAHYSVCLLKTLVIVMTLDVKKSKGQKFMVFSPIHLRNLRMFCIKEGGRIQGRREVCF